MRAKALTYGLTSAGVAAAAVVGAWPVDPGSSWYSSLAKPSWQPPPRACGRLIRRTARTDPRAAAALVPYALWCAFATALNADIARRNR
jgi:tryptophan-rich sensory protein